MKSLYPALNASNGILNTAAHRPLRRKISRAIADNKLVRLFPGVVVPTELAHDDHVRAIAALHWQPDATLMGAAAARATFLPNIKVGDVELVGRPPGHTPPGVRVNRLLLPEELRVPLGPGFVTVPELTVIDLAVAGDWTAMCEALRHKVVSPESLFQANAMLTGRRAVALRSECMLRAQGNPWSIPEMELQTMLRQAGITGWLGNAEVLAGGRTWLGDIVFPELGVIIEVDSRQFHTQAESFIYDKARDLALQAAGWTILHVTPHAISTRPEVVLNQIIAVLTRLQCA